MITPIRNFNSTNIAFRAIREDNEQNTAPKKDMLLENTFSNRLRISIDKFAKAFTIYPARGLKGSINSDFYEFLTMGIVPYVVGSLTLMSVFNGVKNAFKISECNVAAKLGNKMALGVLFYGLFKTISKSFVNLPTKWITGIDTQIPYLRVNHQLPESKDNFDLTSFEYHKAGESVEFTRWDLLFGNPNDKKDLNKRFDKIAKKNGLGENLNDSDQEVKPIYKEVLVKSTLARSISSYLWAACGVALAFQKPWEEFFRGATVKFWKPKEFLHTFELLGRGIKNSSMSMLKTTSGKALLYTAATSTILGVLNTVIIRNKPSKYNEKDVMNENKERVVG